MQAVAGVCNLSYPIRMWEIETGGIIDGGSEIANLEYAAQRQRKERPGSQRVVLWHAHVLSRPRTK